MKSVLSTLCLLIIISPIFGQKVKKFLDEGKIVKAISYCEKKGARDSENGFMLIGNYFLKKGDIRKAIQYYEKSNDPKEGFIKIADVYLRKKRYKNAEEFYLKAGESQKTTNNKIADFAFINKKYDKAAEYYSLAENKDGLRKIADLYLGNQEYDIAVHLFIKSGEDENLVFNKVGNEAFKNTMLKPAIKLYEKAGNKEALNKIAEHAFENKKYKTALIVYTKLSDVEKIAVCKQLFETIKMKTGSWEGEGIRFIISEKGTEIDSLIVKAYDSLNGYIDYKINRKIPIILKDYAHEIFFNGKASFPPFQIEISGEFSDNLDEITVTAATITSSYFHQTGKTVLKKYPTELIAKHKKQ